jgi:hypothetical protein
VAIGKDLPTKGSTSFGQVAIAKELPNNGWFLANGAEGAR